MPYETLLYEKKGRIGYVTLNRPRILNAQSPKMLEDLAQAFGEIKRDPEVGVVILTGAGDRAFCAGADINFLKQLAQTTPIAAKTFVKKIACLRGDCASGETGDRRSKWFCAGRRLRAGHGLPYPSRGKRPFWSAGDQPRPLPRRRWHPTATASGRHGDRRRERC